VVVFVASLACFGLQSVAVSIGLGRDAEDYLIDGWETFERHPLFPRLMLARTPVAGLLIDFFDRLGGISAVEAGLGLVFAAGVTCWVAAARAYGRKAALVMFVLLAVVPAYGLFFHRVSSDPVFASVLGLTALLAVRLAERPSVGRSAAVGVGVAALVLTRPSGEPFILLAVLPLALGGPWRLRVARAAAIAGVTVAILATWAATNDARYGELTVAHGGKSGIPLYHVFVLEPRVQRSNGPASEKVAVAVEHRLLGMEPYRSYGFDADEILQAGNTWALDDVVYAVESEYGARNGSDTLFRAGLEAVRADPVAYAKGVTVGLAGLMLLPYTEAAESNGTAAAVGPPIGDAVLGPPGRGRRLPPDAAASGTLWARAMVKSWALDDSSRYVVRGGLHQLPDAIWDLERRRVDWRSPSDAARYNLIRERLRRFVHETSGGDRRPRMAEALRVGALLLPSAGFWLLVALAFGLRFRPRGIAAPCLLAIASLLVLVETALAFPPHPDYALPLVPTFALLAFAVLSRSRRGRGSPDDAAYAHAP
jgi:4-amino-4-deoxy-L-arabinose transferase-like glycosyltransferase